MVICMNIVLYKDSLFNISELYNEVTTNNFIDGFMVSSSMTKDKKIIVYNFAGDTNTYIDDIQNTDLSTLKENTFIELNEFLNTFKNYKKKIIISLSGYLDLVDKPNRNEEFIKIFKGIIDNYPELDLYICSVYDDIITFIIRYLNNNNVKKGMIVYRGNLNYYDVDFYLTPSNMFDTRVIAQQLKLNKEIILILDNVELIVNIIDEFQKKEYLFNDLALSKSLNLLYISTKAPRVINAYLKSGQN